MQISANDLLTAFSSESATLIQRCVLAELRAKALQSALSETRRQLAEATQARVTVDGEALSRDSGSPVP
jgi:DNA topoisomerase IA